MKVSAENPTCKESLIVQQEGTRQEERLQKLYNLDAIISVGYLIKQAVGSILEQTASDKNAVCARIALTDTDENTYLPTP